MSPYYKKRVILRVNDGQLGMPATDTIILAASQTCYKLVLIIKPKCSLTRKGYSGMPLHVMEQPPRFFALAYRASDACIYQ